jgi:hypothetical protein
VRYVSGVKREVRFGIRMEVKERKMRKIPTDLEALVKLLKDVVALRLEAFP